MPSDKQNAEFMYAMLKQLDLKYIDWSRVAAANNISNGHAARMRFSRYRHAMENAASGKAAPRGTADKDGKETRCRCAGVGGKKRKRGGKGEVGVSGGEDDEEGGGRGWVKKREGSVEGEGEEGPRRTAKVEEGGAEVKAERGMDEDDMPIRLRVKREDRVEVKVEGGKREDGKGSVVFDRIPTLKVEGDD